MATDWKARDAQDKLTREHLEGLMPYLVAALGEGWRFSAPTRDADDSVLPSWYTLHGPDNAELFVGVEFDDKRKLHISAQFCDKQDGQTFWYLPYKTERPSIGVAASRGAPTIANEIKRRLLPDYLPLLAQCNEARKQFEARRQNAAKVAEELANFIGGEVGTRTNNVNHTERAINVYMSEALRNESFDLKVSGYETGARVRFDRLDVPPHVALEILEVLTRHHVNIEEE